MKVLITGATGQLGQALVRIAPSNVEVVALARIDLDLADNDEILPVLTRNSPAVVINAAAYTAVDKAESERDTAFAINAAGCAALAEACRSIGARLAHVSTDFVFDGAQPRPYRPNDAARPLNVYGASKLEGERRIAAVEGLSWIIVRTAWVYAAVGKNFVLTMLRLFNERHTINVVCDQIGTPTSAVSLAHCVWRAALDPRSKNEILHYTDAGAASWYDFAVAVYEEARALGMIEKEIEILPIRTEQYPTPARRPHFSVLDKHDTLARLQIAPVHWRVALRSVLKEIKR